jgi:hypothetical protein
VLAVVLAFSSSLCWGLADFLGGLQSRTRPLVTVLLVAQVAAVAIGIVYVAASARRRSRPARAWRAARRWPPSTAASRSGR